MLSFIIAVSAPFSYFLCSRSARQTSVDVGTGDATSVGDLTLGVQEVLITMRCLQSTPLRIRGNAVPPRPMARTSTQRRHARSLVRAAASEAGGSKPNGALVKALEGALAAVSKVGPCLKWRA